MHETLRVQVKEAMTEKGLSARELARRVGVEPNTVINFLHGTRNTGVPIRRAFCRELGLDYDQTFQKEVQTPA
jgi:transcriptional regulator with XRE-family HTH domain